VADPTEGSTSPEDSPSPQAPAAASPQKPRRTRRFVLPDTHEDDRTDARIEAFLDGPNSKTSRRSSNGTAVAEEPSAVAAPSTQSLLRPRRPFILDTRADWLSALRHEDARHLRYGRPTSVLRIELTGEARGPALDRMARIVADCVRANVRETDRAVRLSTGSLRVLLPETGGRAARVAADRIEQAFASVDARPETVGLKVDIVTPSRGRSIADALADADRRGNPTPPAPPTSSAPTTLAPTDATPLDPVISAKDRNGTT
jgi:hypothetical protein